MRLLAACVLTGLSAVSAHAQAPQAGTPQPREVTWSVAAGYESFWMRDVSRSGTPVDASPVTWTGNGPAVEIHHDRWRPDRLHRFEFAFASASGFVFETPVRTIPVSPADGATHTAGSYEYRRYPFRDVGLNGLAFGVGVEGSVDGQWVTRHFDPSIEIRASGVDVGVAVVAAAELRRSRLVLQAAWANGGTIGLVSTHHSAAFETTDEAWGGGWLTDLRLRADVRIASQAAVLVAYYGTGRGRFASHDANASGRDRIVLGVTYVR